MADVRVGGAYLDWQTRNDRFLSGMRRNRRALSDQERAVQGLQRRIGQFNVVARRMAQGLGVLAVVGAGAAVRAFSDFQQTMAQVQGITRATTREFEALNAQALDLGRNTRFSSQQVAEGQLLLARAGLGIQEIVAALPGTLQLAQAAAVSVGESADIVTNALKAFREGADQTSRFVDVLARTTVSANTDLIQLADGLKLVAPVAKALNVEVETTAAALGVLSDAGLQATLAGTGLRKVLFDLQSPSTSTNRILRDLGLTAEEVSIQQFGLVEVLERLSKAGISATQVIEVFGARGAPAFLNLTASLPRLRELTAELRNSAGSAAELQRVMDDTLAGSFKRLTSAAEGAGIALSERSGLSGALRSATDSTSDLINSLTDNADTLLVILYDTLAVVGLLASGRGIAGLLALRGPVTAAILSITAATQKFNIGIATAAIGVRSLAGPIGALSIVIPALALYFTRMREATNATSEFANATEQFLERGVANEVDILSGAIGVYERRIVRLREQLNQPLSLQGQFNLRAQLGQYEKELRDFRIRLRDAQQKAIPLPPVTAAATPETAGGAAVGTSRNLSAEISAEIERQERVSRQRIEILRAEGQERLRLEARYEVTNRLVDEQLRLSAALVTAKDKERAVLVAEQQALDQSVAGIDALIAAKERQLRLDQQATQLQADIAESLQDAERRTEALTEAAARGTVDRADRLNLLREGVGYVDETAAGWLEVVHNERLATAEARRHTAVARLATEALADGLANAAAHARSLSDALRSIALTLTSSLLRSLLPSLIGGLFSGGASSFTSGSTTSVFGDLGPLTFRQHGGPVGAGQEVIVGEDGPERFRPNRSGQIIPFGGLGGVSVAVGPFNIQSSDGPGVRAALIDVVPVLRDQVIESVKRALRVDSRRPSPA